MLLIVWWILLIFGLMATVPNIPFAYLWQNSKSSMPDVEFAYSLLAVTAITANLFVVGVVSAFCFMAHPTAQFNAGNDFAGDVWSIWVNNYFTVMKISFAAIAVNVAWLLIGIFRKQQLGHIAYFTIASVLGGYITICLAPSA